MRTGISSAFAVLVLLETLFQIIGDASIDTFISAFKEVNIPHTYFYHVEQPKTTSLLKRFLVPKRSGLHCGGTTELARPDHGSKPYF